MELKDFARQYAIDALESEVEKISQSYIAGYNKAWIEIGRPPIDIDGIKYYDFGLPSGTLWSYRVHESSTRNRLLTLPYKKANMMNLPTLEQLKELYDYCRISERGRGEYQTTIFLGPTGHEISLSNRLGFWLKDSLQENNYAKSFRPSSNLCVDESFIGESKFILLVK